ncbi:Transmembrane protein 242 [Chionoecetes opilio]|uniref:Transmembrane protein 242 n=1 Tax=Chionoecetes opilio TaxID=41210 RepID=A0A8J4XM72_CHIOP|nr:Transmembrane protein 242 [Chionoecetes opilio]
MDMSNWLPELNTGLQEHRHDERQPKESKKFKYLAAAFLTGVAGVSMLGGFGMTLGMVKKKDPNMFNKGMMGAREVHEAGGALALRALGRGSLYAVAGFSVFCLSVWKLSGAKDLQDFGKGGKYLPKIPKKRSSSIQDRVWGADRPPSVPYSEDERKRGQESPGPNSSGTKNSRGYKKNLIER